MKWTTVLLAVSGLMWLVNFVASPSPAEFFCVFACSVMAWYDYVLTKTLRIMEELVTP